MYQKYTKRLLDLTLALIILVLTLPVFALIALAIKIESKGPVFFTQERTGLGGKKFKLRKFRSMTHGNNVRDLSKKDEVTKIGGIIRALSLDEVPQFINVLQGEMSFIGPRPWIPEYFEHMNPKQRKRADVLPGITGLAQAYGRNSLTINQKINYDLTYVKKISFKEDCQIIFLTLKTMFDKTTHEIGKSGIHGELDILKKQHSTTNQDDGISLKDKIYS